MEYPLYSSDLVFSNYWLLSYMKYHDHLDEDNLVTEIGEIVNSIPQSEWKKTFEKLLERMRLCVKNKSDYFENLMK